MIAFYECLGENNFSISSIWVLMFGLRICQMKCWLNAIDSAWTCHQAYQWKPRL